MSTICRPPVFLGLSILLACAGTAAAQPVDPLEQAGLELKIKAQKLLREVNANFDSARLLSRSNPEKARDILSRTKALLEDDNISLSARQRDDLLRQINVKLVEVTREAKAQKIADDLAAAQAAEKLRLEKKLAADDLKARSGITPSMVVDAKIQQVYAQKKMMQAYLERLKKMQTDQYYGQVDKSSPKYKDIEIMRMLNSWMTVDFMDTPFLKALDYIDEKAERKLNFSLDDPALKEAMFDPNDKSVTLKMKKFKVRTILKNLLGAQGLDYYLEDGSLRITTAKVAQEQQVIKLYPVRNLVGGGGGSPAMMMMMGQMAKQNAQSLALLMMNTIEPKYWFINGGPGQVDWDARTMSLAIKASMEIHYMLKASEILNNNRPPGQVPLQ